VIKTTFDTKINFLPNNFSPKTFDQKQKFIQLISTQEHQNFTSIHQESQFTINDPFSSKLNKQQQLNHNFTNNNTQGINYHQQHNITSIKA